MSQVVELVIEELKRHKSSGSDQISTELIKTWGRTICYEIHKSIIKEELPEEWKSRSLYYKKGDKTDCSNYRGISLITFAYYIENFVQHPAVKVNSICRGNYWGSSMWISMQQLNY